MTSPTRGFAVTSLAVAASLAISSCGSWQRVGEAPQPTTEREITQMFDAAGMFQRMGRLVSTQNISYIGSVAYVPGPGDSTSAIVALSLANRAFAFERNPGNGFGAHYRVEYEFDRPGAPPVVISRDNSLLVPSFQETLRTDESVIEQQRINLAPGSYTLLVRVRDKGNLQVGTATDHVIVPAFEANSYTAPILVYRVRGRATRNDSLSLVMNPRGTVAYGGDTLLIYFEGNNFSRPTDIPVQVRDEHDSLVTRTMLHFAGNRPIEGQLIRVAPDSAPLGQLEIIVGPDNGAPNAGAPNRFAIAPGGDPTHRTNAVVSFSNAWIVTNFDDLLSLLRYFGEDRRVLAMRKAKNSDRVSMWQDFYKATDPIPATPENEALDAYFARIAIANQRFREPNRPGWRTDRGEVFIGIGEPDEIHDQSAQLQNAGRYIQWVYNDFRITLYFQDISGFSHFQLTPESRADYERIHQRVQRDNRSGNGGNSSN